MTPYYILRLLPPLGILNKYHFENLQSLIECVANLYQTLDINSLDMSESDRNNWRLHSLDLFCESIIITRVDPNMSEAYKHFTNLEQGRRAKIYALPKLSEITEEITA